MDSQGKFKIVGVSIDDGIVFAYFTDIVPSSGDNVNVERKGVVTEYDVIKRILYGNDVTKVTLLVKESTNVV